MFSHREQPSFAQGMETSRPLSLPGKGADPGVGGLSNLIHVESWCNGGDLRETHGSGCKELMLINIDSC